MKDEIDKIDELIKEALTAEEAAFYDELEERNLFGKLGAVYKGKTGWLAVVMNIVHLICFFAFAYCVYRFFNTEVTNELIKWALGGMFCVIAMGRIKAYVWMQMDKNDILRELKRLELQVLALAHKKEDK